MPVERGPGGERIYVDSGPKPSSPPGPVTRISKPVPIVPCTDCLHNKVCNIKDLLDAEVLGKLIGLEMPPMPNPALKAVHRIEVHCDYFLSNGKPSTVKPSAAAHPWRPPNPDAPSGEGMTGAKQADRRLGNRAKLPKDPQERLDTIVDAIRGTETVALAAESLGISRPTLHRYIEGLKDSDRLPQDVRELLAGRGHRSVYG